VRFEHGTMSRMGSGIEIRAARVGDADSLAEAWREFGHYYADIDSDQFRVPDAEGLPAWFESRLEEERGDDTLWLVAERARQVIGFVQAQIWPPAEDADRHLMREMGEPILKVDSIMVLEDERGAGVGTALMSAVERWGHDRGATRAVVISYANSPSSVPFYENRMRYERHTVGF
jgi:GNAT superfamily N-acetyltransferase